MSIINDALKKVQQSLSSKAGETPVTPPEIPQKSSSNLFETPSVPETLPQKDQQAPPPAPIQNKIKSVLAFICALAITAGSGWYIYKQYQQYIPRAQRMVKTSFYKLIHKEEIPDFKTKRPEDLKPLAQITINPATPTAAVTNTAPPAPITLNVHGIMSNASGNLALINDQVYQEGDEVDGAKIIKIDLNSITVNINGAEETIHVKS